MRLTSSSSLVLVFLLWLLFVLGCGNGTYKRPSATPFIKYEGSGKIVVTRDDSQNKSYYRLDDFKFRPDEPKLPVSDDFELNFEAESVGDTPPQTITTTLIHDTASKTHWHFQRDTNLSIVADGSEFSALKCRDDSEKQASDSKRCYELDLRKDEPADLKYYETLIFELATDDLRKMAGAKVLQLKIGDKVITMTPDALNAVRDFAGALK